ncbi:DUF3263 domain-containing protein [Microbacterium sp.]|uniref:DUF3263 domain-containing protein n=1 Tax=Microbacterium sp. TaxID=51671 RepID=UPI0025E10C4E|nr:DUF3263 domain-containing protein [Microbacterium sp.]
MTLSDRDLALLEFEARWQQHGAAKEEAIRRELALSPARYYQLLNRLIDTADALAHDPLLVHRLRRLREVRAREHVIRATASAGPAR